MSTVGKKMSVRLSVVPSASPDWDDSEEITRQLCVRPGAREDSGIWSLQELTAEPEVVDQATVYRNYSPLVRRISLKAVRTLPRSVSLEDIISAGWVGMSEALRRRPHGMPEEQFEAYSSYRIRGAILDYLRALDPLSRRLRLAAREIAAATRDLTLLHGMAPSEEQLASHLRLTLDQLQKSMADIQQAGADKLDSGAGLDAPSTEPSPEAMASRNQMVNTILNAMKQLPERLQVVLTLHYQNECSLREIGEILKVTESRVCQLHAEAVQRIKVQIEGTGSMKKGLRRRHVAI